MGHLAVPCMLTMQYGSGGTLLIPFVSGSRASQKALTPKQNNPVRLAVFYFKRNREGKGFGGATLSKNCAALGRFPLACVIF